MTTTNDDRGQPALSSPKGSPRERSSAGGVDCPFCGSADSELISPFGSQLLTSQRRCPVCRGYFEALRDDR